MLTIKSNSWWLDGTVVAAKVCRVRGPRLNPSQGFTFFFLLYLGFLHKFLFFFTHMRTG